MSLRRLFLAARLVIVRKLNSPVAITPRAVQESDPLAIDATTLAKSDKFGRRSATRATTLAKSDEFGQPLFTDIHPAFGQEIKRPVAKLVAHLAKQLDTTHQVSGPRFQVRGRVQESRFQRFVHRILHSTNHRAPSVSSLTPETCPLPVTRHLTPVTSSSEIFRARAAKCGVFVRTRFMKQVPKGQVSGFGFEVAGRVEETGFSKSPCTLRPVTSLKPVTCHLTPRRSTPVTCHLKPSFVSAFLLLVALFASPLIYPQSTSATVNGQITDPAGKVVPGTAVQAVNIDTNITFPSKTNDTGIYVIPNLPPGRYRLVVTRDGFKQINQTDITLNVQDNLEQNFSLEVGSTSESVTVEGSGVNMNTASARAQVLGQRAQEGRRAKETGSVILAIIVLLLAASTRRQPLVRSGQNMSRILHSKTTPSDLRPLTFLSPLALALSPLLAFLFFSPLVFAQSTSATLNGQITDPSGKVIPGTSVQAVNIDTNISYPSRTNETGIYVIPNLPPGRYRLVVTRDGFKQINKTDITLNVQDNLEQNFSLEVGSTSESVTVEGSGVNINTADGSVSTVIDRQFVENMPLNGRSFQDLLTLSPGVANVGNAGSGGQTRVGAAGEITVNGQRTEANNFTVDGVSSNTGTPLLTTTGGAGFSGSVPGETVLGTTQSLVSVDALEEFRVQTSTYSAEFGRTPGGQFSLLTRSGTNQWHGTAYDYFRNDVLDANNWFNNAATPQVRRLPERQNDFGGTLGGPIILPGLYNGKEKTFFFISYEGLRLVVPQPFSQQFVPDLCLRDATSVCTGMVVSPAYQALRPLLNAFPLPSKDQNGTYIEDGRNDGLGVLNRAYSAPSSLDNVGVRIDHTFGDKLKLFGRFANTPSSGWLYGALGSAFKLTQEINVRTLTLGATSSISRTQQNQLRFNVTQDNTNEGEKSTNFGGAVPINLNTLPGPGGGQFSPLGSQLEFGLLFGGRSLWSSLQNNNDQRQYNLTDTYSWSAGAHSLRFGFDWRRLTTFINPLQLFEAGFFFSEASVLANHATLADAIAFSAFQTQPVYQNFSAFAQDEWRATNRLSLSLGLRWDVNPAPGNQTGPSPSTVDQITNLATTKLAPAGTPLWHTDWHGFAPRVGLAYQLRQGSGNETLLRTGFGLFYDMGSTQGSQGFTGIGFTTSNFFRGVSFPLTSAQVTLPPPSVQAPYGSAVFAFDPNLKLPYTMQWNVALEQALGRNQSLTVNYVASGGRNLLTQFESFPNPDGLGNQNFGTGIGLFLTSNRARSSYNSAQVKYQAKFSHGLEALASYTWSHSIDDASNNFQLFELERASSDFDLRHNFQSALTYDVPGCYSNSFISAFLEHWGLDARVSAATALPTDIIASQQDIDPATQQQLNFHPDLVPGQPIYLRGSQYPGRRIINYNAFLSPTDASGNPVEGNLPRNFARGFPTAQANLALRREFPIREQLHLQFRAEAFNVFNHPSFGQPDGMLQDGQGLFGYSQSSLSNQLGGLNALYQSGGPRSLQLMLKLQF